MNFEDVFDRKDFHIEKIILENNSPNRKFLIYVKGYKYFINYNNLFRFLKNNDINLEIELKRLHIPIERIDTRPLYRKAMDIQLGRKVDFGNPINYPLKDEMFLKRILTTRKDL